MRIGFNMVLFLFLFNLICGLMYASNVPGTQFSNIITGTGTAEEYQERVNPETFMNKTEPEASESYTFVGNIYSGLSALWDGVRFTIFGFPTMMMGIGGQIQDAQAKNVFYGIVGVMSATMYLIGFLWLYELWSGRRVED